MRLGQFEVWPLSDGTFKLDGGQMFGVVPKVMWEKKAPVDERNRIRMGLNGLLVRTGKLNILIETGIGERFDAKFADIYGVEKSASLPAQLATHGLAWPDIDIVINTHLHFDHCGWNTRRDGGELIPSFPRARYYVQRGEWEHALHPTLRDRASYNPELFQVAEGQTEFLEGDQRIVPGVSVEVLPGHNRYMQGVRIESAGEQVYFISDLVPMRPHLAYPWIASLDLYPLETLANKQRLLPRLVEERAIVVFPHEADAPWATLVNRDGKIEAKGLSH
ncbi:MAG TPA: MBL fold metallo-hydrolase [Terriglobia bacterium]|nr:MBL fold metallo-hydrolase [Terriglobia bacterium]